MPVEPLTDADPLEVGPYRLRARIGAGGMGRVYLAYTVAGRPVAIKTVRDDLAGDREFRARFQREVQAARLVSGLYTAEVVDFDTGCERPWLATEYVLGPSLQDVLGGSGPLPPDAVWLLTAGLAEALRDIHRAGLLHRDLKPANVLLARDGPRVIDFGIARAMDGTQLTRTGLRVGSPQFMAPEQATGDELTPAADVFALGALVVAAATGRAPFGEGPDAALLYRVMHEPPDLGGVPDGLRELATACLRKEPGQRPGVDDILRTCQETGGVGTAAVQGGWPPAGIAADIQQRTAELPRPEVTLRRGRRRRLWPLAAAAVVVLLVIGLMAVAGVWPFESATSRPGNRASAPPPAVAVLLGGEPEKGVAVSQDGRTVAAAGVGHAVNIWNRTDQRITVVLAGHTCDVQASAFSQDGRAVVTGSCDHTVRVWSVPVPGSPPTPQPPSVGARVTTPPASGQPAPPTERQLVTLRLPDGETLVSVAFDAGGHAVALTRAVDGTTRLWDVLTGQVTLTLAVPKWVDAATTAVFAGDGRTVTVAGGTDRRVRVFDVASGRSLGEVDGEPGGVRALALSPDGRVLATSGTGDPTVRLWDVPGRRLLGTLPAQADTAQALAFSPDGRVLAVGGADHTVTLWDVAQRALLHTLTGHTDAVLSVRFSADGTVLATGGADRTVRLWDTSGLLADGTSVPDRTAAAAVLPSATTYHDDFDLDQALQQIRALDAVPETVGPVPPGPVRAFSAVASCTAVGGVCQNLYGDVFVVFFDGPKLVDHTPIGGSFIQSQDGHQVVVQYPTFRDGDGACCPSGVHTYTFTVVDGKLVSDPPLPDNPNQDGS